jgi:hypothetical protein
VTGSIELNALGVDHLSWSTVDGDPDEQSHALELLLARDWSLSGA